MENLFSGRHMNPLIFTASVNLPTHCVIVKPPVPTTEDERLSIKISQGRILVFFDEWDVGWNDPAHGDELFDNIKVSVILDIYPTEILNPSDRNTEWGSVLDWVSSP